MYDNGYDGYEPTTEDLQDWANHLREVDKEDDHPFAWDATRNPVTSSETAIYGYYQRSSAWPWHCINQARRILFSLEHEFSKTTDEGKRILRRARQHLQVEDEKRLYIQAMAMINT